MTISSYDLHVLFQNEDIKYNVVIRGGGGFYMHVPTNDQEVLDD